MKFLMFEQRTVCFSFDVFQLCFGWVCVSKQITLHELHKMHLFNYNGRTKFDAFIFILNKLSLALGIRWRRWGSHGLLVALNECSRKCQYFWCLLRNCTHTWLYLLSVICLAVPWFRSILCSVPGCALTAYGEKSHVRYLFVSVDCFPPLTCVTRKDIPSFRCNLNVLLPVGSTRNAQHSVYFLHAYR